MSEETITDTTAPADTVTGDTDDTTAGATGDTTDNAKTDDAGKDNVDKADGQEPKGKTFDEDYVKKLRDEAASARTDKQQLKGVLDAINKALNPDATDTDKVDPDKLAADLTAERNAHTNLQREHQVLLSAIDAGADHAALLDSRAFLAKVANLDPTGSKFTSEVKAAVEAALKENPKLKAAQVAGKGGVDNAGGTGENGAKPTTLEDAIAQKMGV